MQKKGRQREREKQTDIYITMNNAKANEDGAKETKKGDTRRDGGTQSRAGSRQTDIEIKN